MRSTDQFVRIRKPVGQSYARCVHLMVAGEDYTLCGVAITDHVTAGFYSEGEWGLNGDLCRPCRKVQLEQRRG